MDQLRRQTTPAKEPQFMSSFISKTNKNIHTRLKLGHGHDVSLWERRSNLTLKLKVNSESYRKKTTTKSNPIINMPRTHLLWDHATFNVISDD